MSIFTDFIGIYCLIRSKDAGVFAGTLIEVEGGNARIQNARRLWKWKGASSLSELSQKGVLHPESCMFPCEVPEILVLGIIEVIPCSTKAIDSIASVPEWSSHCP